MSKQTKPQATELQVMTLRTGRMSICIRGTSPLIFNAMSEKVRQELLLPKGRKTAADKATTLKHSPVDEFRTSVYAHREDNHQTRLLFPCGAFKKAAMTAALDLPGMKKTEIGRLLWIESANIDIYGIPQLLMSVVRSADMNRTPDIRTRAILAKWACSISINYVRPKLGDQQIGNLFAAAGLLAGIGDGRQEKGAFNFGQFQIVSEDDAEFQAIIASGGREAQDSALKTPAPYDLESERLLAWYHEQIAQMGDKVVHMKVRAA